MYSVVSNMIWFPFDFSFATTFTPSYEQHANCMIFCYTPPYDAEAFVGVYTDRVGAAGARSS